MASFGRLPTSDGETYIGTSHRKVRNSVCPGHHPVTTRHTTGIASPLCVDRLPSHISKMVVSTVKFGGPLVSSGSSTGPGTPVW